jgi:hypothetical protein
MHNSYCPALLGYKILLRSLQGCSSFQCHHYIACLLMRKPHLCFNPSSRTFSLVTLKFHCLGTLLFQLEFFLFDNYFIFWSVINSVLQHAISVHVFYLVKSAWYLQHIGVGIVDTAVHFPSTGWPMIQSSFENNLFHEADFRWDVGMLVVKSEV